MANFLVESSNLSQSEYGLEKPQLNTLTSPALNESAYLFGKLITSETNAEYRKKQLLESVNAVQIPDNFVNVTDERTVSEHRLSLEVKNGENKKTELDLVSTTVNPIVSSEVNDDSVARSSEGL
uniref:Flagellar hook capping protein n=1 Tax=Syphacia muris TaxID=451379 RepID=A0A0N5ANC5_9BILA